ncbi:TPA: hypothetical protein QDB21_005611 [Burkholderia vietnamiensis]|nr:hypothetical protein [Burkholderia vietnamiensis]
MKARRPQYIEPARTVLVSGDIERDARYTLALPTKPQRRHELWRLGHLHGGQHQAAVEKRVTELWEQTQQAA